jgi:FkbM family methyltransferase
VVERLRAQLQSLLGGDARALADAERRMFDEAAMGRGDTLVLMGAGGLGRRALAALRRKGVEPLAFVDNSPLRQGTVVDGVQVLSPVDAARAFGARAAFVVTIWGANSPHRFEDSRRQMNALGCEVVLPFPLLFWKYPEGTLPHYAQDLPHRVLEDAGEVLRAAELWEDDASCEEYLSQVRFRLLADFDGLAHPVAHPQYFPEDLFTWRDDEWIVDGGAYDGDSVRTLVKLHGERFAHVLALEPDPANFAKLETTVALLPAATRSKIDCRQLALASAHGTLHLDAMGNASSSTAASAGAGTIAVPAEPLDAILAGAAPSFIKLDIEGAELDALLGAQATIRAYAPIIAVCVYHRQDHLWSIPLMLREWRDDYAFFLRPHNEEGWDLVCYAVPRARLTERRA